jgi:hypothetical protein
METGRDAWIMIRGLMGGVVQEYTRRLREEMDKVTQE